jgi:hypothetical protein
LIPSFQGLKPQQTEDSPGKVNYQVNGMQDGKAEEVSRIGVQHQSEKHQFTADHLPERRIGGFES